MKRNKMFWPIATAVIYFVAGWVLNSSVSVIERRADIRVASVQLENQLESILVTKKRNNELLTDYKNLLEVKYDLGNDTFRMLGGEQQLTDLKSEISYLKTFVEEQEKSYNNMAQMADPAVFNGGLPARISPVAHGGKEI